jgi:hypothetical protein
MANTPADTYSEQYGVTFAEKLGEGKDGRVFNTTRDTAVKFCFDQETYARELRAYVLLTAKNIESIFGFQIPLLENFDDALLAIEMSVVTPPFLLDFAAAYTREEIERFAFTEDVIAEREAHWADIFGDRWPETSALRDEFERRTGFVLLDLNLNNIRFE